VATAVRLLQVPYDSGVRDARMGAGPGVLARAGAAARLRARGHVVREDVLHPAGGWHAELRTAFELQRTVAEAATDAHDRGEVPLLLSGNCNATVGMLAALRPGTTRVGLVWLDAHGDLNTPATDARGFLDGHGLAMALGRCWGAATADLPGFAALPEEQVVLVGARDLDPAEEEYLSGAALHRLTPDRARDPGATSAALDSLAGRVDVVHLHVDLDVHDPSIAPANGYAAPDGLSAADVQRIARQVAGRVRLASGTLAAYDPAYDPSGRMRDTGLALLEVLAEVAG
jgi:arginase